MKINTTRNEIKSNLQGIIDLPETREYDFGRGGYMTAPATMYANNYKRVYIVVNNDSDEYYQYSEYNEATGMARMIVAKAKVQDAYFA